MLILSAVQRKIDRQQFLTLVIVSARTGATTTIGQLSNVVSSFVSKGVCRQQQPFAQKATKACCLPRLACDTSRACAVSTPLFAVKLLE